MRPIAWIGIWSWRQAQAHPRRCIRSLCRRAGRRGRCRPDAFVLASPLSGWRAKQWPLESYARLARAAPRRRNSAGAERSAGGSRGARPACRTRCCICRRSKGLIDATRRAAAVVGVDSGPLHLAAALGKPGVAIFGPTDPAQTGPYGGSLTVLRSPRRHHVVQAARRNRR